MLPQSTNDHYLEQQRFGVLAATQIKRLWSGVGQDYNADWYPRIAQAASVLKVSQAAAAVTSAAYTPALMFETRVEAAPAGDIVPAAFVGVNRYGQAVEDTLAGATTVAKNYVGRGYSSTAARDMASVWLTAMVLTVVGDTGRSTVSADIAQRPTLTGYVRMLNGPSCNRCIILAGKWFRWNEGFQRHPQCDCRHIGAPRESWAKAEGFVTDPYEAFNNLSSAEQDKAFGAADAQAIRDGGDIYRVTNIRVRGLANAEKKNMAGRNSGWQARLYGTPSRMTIDDIYTAAGNDRAMAVSLMEREGFITGPQVVGGNIKGRYFEGYAGAMGRGGTRKGATIAFQRAQATGVRDRYSPDSRVSFDSATQTAAERRLHTAYLNQRAVTEGRNPFTANTRRQPLTPQIRQTVQTQYDKALADLANQPDQVRRLARLLGMI